MPASELAIESALERPDRSFGVHLTFVCDSVEAPVTDPEKVRSLLRPDGRFLESNTLRKMALLGKIPEHEIEIEAAAQIDLLTSRGIRVSHVDSHGHLHKFAPFRRALSKVLKSRGIERVRNVQDIYLRRPLKSPTYWLGPWWRRRLMREFRTTDHFYMCTSAWDSDWPAELLARKISGTMEVGVHPGHAEPWRQAEHRAIQELHRLALRHNTPLVGWSAV